ncbi:maleylpyruvate isomerase N-terminal domain-containing protein [Streptomyces sp. NPDC004609]|uniref:maleylpyruvate isomerase N-terminal domain-containing protein n=1 Tax=Streptomyces sp. NPDC004609 TaxID=3364704 RepID=UPI0036AEEC92
MNGPLKDDDPEEVRDAPRIPGPRAAGDDLEPPAPAGTPAGVPRPRGAGESEPPANTAEADMPGTPAPPAPEGPSHSVLKSLLGAWALSACSAEETSAVEEHLGDCAVCADEALRLRGAVELLHTERDLDLDPLLRFRVLENCLVRRPARIPVPEWAAPYDAETARLDALLRDIGDAEWHAPVRLKWFDGAEAVNRRTTVAGVIGHLMTVDGLVAGALGLDDPLGRAAPRVPLERTEKFWRADYHPAGRGVHATWREQSHTLIRTVSFAGQGVADMPVSYGDFALPLRDSLLDRAFECWMHADDIAGAVAYPYAPPRGSHLHRMIDLAARLLPAALAGRRRAGLAAPARQLVAAGAPGRSLHLEVEGAGGGDWYIALDSPAALGSPDHTVAQVALDGVEFCRLVAGHVPPEEAAAGQDGDREAIRDVLFAAASLSRL